MQFTTHFCLGVLLFISEREAKTRVKSRRKYPTGLKSTAVNAKGARSLLFLSSFLSLFFALLSRFRSSLTNATLSFLRPSTALYPTSYCACPIVPSPQGWDPSFLRPFSFLPALLSFSHSIFSWLFVFPSFILHVFSFSLLRSHLFSSFVFFRDRPLCNSFLVVLACLCTEFPFIYLSTRGFSNFLLFFLAGFSSLVFSPWSFSQFYPIAKRSFYRFPRVNRISLISRVFIEFHFTSRG